MTNVRKEACIGDIVLGWQTQAKEIKPLVVNGKALAKRRGLIEIRSGEYRLVYAMKITETLGFQQYYHDKRFEARQPDFTSLHLRHWVGDNIYCKDSLGRISQESSLHSHASGSPNQDRIDQDTKPGTKILIASEDSYVYFGARAPAVDQKFADLHHATVGHCGKRLDGPERFELAQEMIDSLGGWQGRVGFPLGWGRYRTIEQPFLL